MRRALLVGLVLAACNGKDGASGRDQDEDGFLASEDCDDLDASVNPDASEICDDVDNDCDGLVDNDDTSLWDGVPVYTDADGDGYGQDDSVTAACAPGDGQSAEGGDCDDDDEARNPGAAELCNGSDDDCDGDEDDEDSDLADGLTVYDDRDEDGYGDEDSAREACELGRRESEVGGDCDDRDEEIHPGATERCDGADNDCDEGTDEAGTAWWESARYGWVDVTTDLAAGTADDPVDYAIADPGTLHLCAGTWYAALSVESSATIAGEAGPDGVILDGGDQRTVIAIQADELDVSVSGVTIQHGSGDIEALYGLGGGGAVYCAGESALALSDVILTANSADWGGAVFQYNCEIEFTSSILSGNSATYGGGVVATGGQVRFIGSEISENEARYSGGGVLMSSAHGVVNLTLNNSVVSGNSASKGGGIFVTGGTTSDVLACMSVDGGAAGVFGNTADDGGGGVYLWYDNLRDTVISERCDWGTEEGGDDNSPVDIGDDDGTYSFSFGDEASFVCESGSCADVGAR